MDSSITYTTEFSAEGWLKKEEMRCFYLALVPHWNDRYFVLDSEAKRLSCFEDSTKTSLRGEYVLDSSTALDDNVLWHMKKFLINTRTVQGQPQTLSMCASTLDIKIKWVDALKKAIKVFFAY